MDDDLEALSRVQLLTAVNRLRAASERSGAQFDPTGALMRTGYLALAVLGAVAPCVLFIPWLRLHGPDLRALVVELFSTRIGGFFVLDVLISAVVLLAFIARVGCPMPGPRCWRPAWSV